MYMQARYYDPVIGRFYSNDPVSSLGHLSRGSVQGFNRYNYAYNNPYKYIDPDGQIPLIPIAIFVAKEIIGGAVEEATGVPVTVKGVGKSLAKNLTKKQLSRKLRRTKAAKDIKSRTGTRNGGKCEFCGDADATATDHLETTISEVADAVLDGEMTFEQADQAANNEGNAADSCTSCNSSKGTKKVGRGFNPKSLSKRLKTKLGSRIRKKDN
jgi:RHS repeat-associated protein